MGNDYFINFANDLKQLYFNTNNISVRKEFLNYAQTLANVYAQVDPSGNKPPKLDFSGHKAPPAKPSEIHPDIASFMQWLKTDGAKTKLKNPLVRKTLIDLTEYNESIAKAPGSSGSWDSMIRSVLNKPDKDTADYLSSTKTILSRFLELLKDPNLEGLLSPYQKAIEAGVASFSKIGYPLSFPAQDVKEDILTLGKAYEAYINPDKATEPAKPAEAPKPEAVTTKPTVSPKPAPTVKPVTIKPGAIKAVPSGRKEAIECRYNMFKMLLKHFSQITAKVFTDMKRPDVANAINNGALMSHEALARIIDIPASGSHGMEVAIETADHVLNRCNASYFNSNVEYIKSNALSFVGLADFLDVWRSQQGTSSDIDRSKIMSDKEDIDDINEKSGVKPLDVPDAKWASPLVLTMLATLFEIMYSTYQKVERSSAESEDQVAEQIFNLIRDRSVEAFPINIKYFSNFVNKKDPYTFDYVSNKIAIDPAAATYFKDMVKKYQKT